MHRSQIPVDAYRLIDFFVTFPFELRIIRLRGSKLKRLADEFETVRPYKWTSEPAYTFLQMAEFQTTAVRSLAQQSVVDRGALEKDQFALSSDFEPEASLREKVDEFLGRRANLINALLEIVDEEGITGKDGLKARSGLMPYKYDVATDAVLN